VSAGSVAARSVAVLVLSGGLVAGCGRDGGSRPSSGSSREQSVAEHSAQVMPFDQAGSTHDFKPTDTGLVETVTSKPPADPAQVVLIRDHLTREAEAFAVGNFEDPAEIHGDDMPGLATLRANPDKLTVAYTEVPAGGRITYTGATPAVVGALHRYGEIQTTDHGHR
jgi:hypothetical protein